MAFATLRTPLVLGIVLALLVPGLPEVTPAEPEEKTPAESKLAIETLRAKAAAEKARTASRRANEVAAHSIRITEHAQAALKHVHQAVRSARVETEGLTKEQKQELKKAEDSLREATKAGEYSNATTEREKDLEKKLKEKMEAEAKQHKQWKRELEEMREQVEKLREELAGTKQADKLHEIEEMLKDLSDEKATKTFSHEELKAELEKLREAVERITKTKDKGAVEVRMGPKTKAPERMVAAGEAPRSASAAEAAGAGDPEASPSRAGLDVDTSMPYGAIEPFGREDTAQELTEASIRESNAMVDQVERAEVAEEKRATFRALTRLRGAAIASYDGVARSQTGNVDEYSKLHKWRKAHPLRHLAQDEADISKWAFPDANM